MKSFEDEIYILLAMLEASEPDMEACLQCYDAIRQRAEGQLRQLSSEAQADVIPKWQKLLEQAIAALTQARVDLQHAMNQIKGQKRIQDAYLKSP